MSAEKLRTAAVALQAAKVAFNAALEAWRAECPHLGTTVEAPHARGILFDHLPSRACEACGTWEQGWTFKALTGRAYPVKETVPLRIEPQSTWVHPTIARLMDGGAS